MNGFTLVEIIVAIAIIAALAASTLILTNDSIDAATDAEKFSYFSNVLLRSPSYRDEDGTYTNFCKVGDGGLKDLGDKFVKDTRSNTRVKDVLGGTVNSVAKDGGFVVVDGSKILGRCTSLKNGFIFWYSLSNGDWQCMDSAGAQKVFTVANLPAEVKDKSKSPKVRCP